jgi:HEAT repeat protein
MKYGNRETELNRGNGHGNDSSTLSELTAALRSDDGVVREHARRSLVATGSSVVETLIAVLQDGSHQLRWEAAKVLGDIADQRAAAALVTALEDEEFDVRWLAAEGLIRIGPRALVPLIEELEKRPESIWLRQGTHHVLHDLSDEQMKAEVKPLLKALESREPEIRVIKPALDLLDRLKPSSGGE